MSQTSQPMTTTVGTWSGGECSFLHRSIEVNDENSNNMNIFAEARVASSASVGSPNTISKKLATSKISELITSPILNSGVSRLSNMDILDDSVDVPAGVQDTASPKASVSNAPLSRSMRMLKASGKVNQPLLCKMTKLNNFKKTTSFQDSPSKSSIQHYYHPIAKSSSPISTLTRGSECLKAVLTSRASNISPQVSLEPAVTKKVNDIVEENVEQVESENSKRKPEIEETDSNNKRPRYCPLPLETEKPKESDDDSLEFNMSTEKDTPENVPTAEGTSLVTPTKGVSPFNFRPSSLRRSLNILKRTGTSEGVLFSPTTTSSTNGTTTAASTSSSPSLRPTGGLAYKRMGVASYSPGRGSACLQAVKAKQDEKKKETIQQFEADLIVIDTASKDADTPKSILKNKSFGNSIDSSKKRVLFAEPVVSKKLFFDANLASLSTPTQGEVAETVADKENAGFGETDQPSKPKEDLVKKGLATIITPVRQFSVDESGQLGHEFLCQDTEEDDEMEKKEEEEGNKQQEEAFDKEPEKEEANSEETLAAVDNLPKDEATSVEIINAMNTTILIEPNGDLEPDANFGTTTPEVDISSGAFDVHVAASEQPDQEAVAATLSCHIDDEDTVTGTSAWATQLCDSSKLSTTDNEDSASSVLLKNDHDDEDERVVLGKKSKPKKKKGKKVQKKKRKLTIAITLSEYLHFKHLVAKEEEIEERSRLLDERETSLNKRLMEIEDTFRSIRRGVDHGLTLTATATRT